MNDTSSTPEAPVYAWSFANATFDEGRWELVVAGEVQALERKPLEVLSLLLRHAGEVVTKDELLESVWTGRVVVEGALTNAIGKLRKALGDEEQAVIATVPKVGYRFLARVERKTAKRLPTVSQLHAGDTVPRRPNWKLETRLDAASDTEVWLARHAKTGETRVFKFSLDGSRLAGLKREATVSRLLKAGLGEREDLVRVIDWDFEDAPYFLECEYGGQDLLAWAESQGGLSKVPMAERLDWMRQICETVDAAHGLGVLHKDLKPSNLLMKEKDGRWQPRVADFGSSRLADASQLDQYGITNLGFSRTIDQTSSDSGTPYYIAPEVLAGGVATARSDLFALGVLLYQMVVGDLRKPLFPGWEREISDEVLREDIALAAHGDPEARLGSARELAQRLAMLEGRRAEFHTLQSALAKQAVAERQLQQARARRPWILASSVLLVLGLAASLFYLMRAQEAQRQAEEQLETTQSLLAFMTQDLLGQADPHKSGKGEVSVQDALDRSVESIGTRFKDRPSIEGSIRHAVGMIYAGLSKLEKSVEQLRLARGLFERSGGATSQQFFDTYGSAIQSYAQLGRYDDAKKELDEFRAKIDQFPDAGVPLQVQYLAAKVEIENTMQRQDDAIKSVEEALQLAKDSEEIPQSKKNLLEEKRAEFYTLAGRYDEAVPLYGAIIERLEREDGPKAAVTLRVLLTYAQLLFATGKNDEGFEVAHRLERDMPVTMGPDDPMIGSVHGLMAEGHLRSNRPLESAESYRKAYEIYAKKLGAASPYTLQMHYGQGESLRHAKRPEQAIEVFKAALATAQSSLPKESPITYVIAWNYAYAALDIGKADDAESLMPNIDNEVLRTYQDGADWPARIALVKGRLALAKHEKSKAIEELSVAEERFKKVANDPAFLEDTRRFIEETKALP